MEVLNYIFLFCFGSVLASFLNLCVYRIENESPIWRILSGRSFCENCKKDLEWFELIPIISFLFLKGKCSKCNKDIGCFNFFSEILLGTVFLFFAIFKIPFLFYPFLLLLYFWAVYDFHYQSIPKKITDVIFLISLLYWIIILFLDFNLERIVPVLIVLFLSLIVFLVSFKKMIFGLGDILVVVVLAFWFETNLFLTTLFYSFIVGGVFSIFLVIKDRSYLKKYVPFLPFIFFGFILSLLSNFSGFKLLEYLLGLC